MLMLSLNNAGAASGQVVSVLFPGGGPPLLKGYAMNDTNGPRQHAAMDLRRPLNI